MVKNLYSSSYFGLFTEGGSHYVKILFHVIQHSFLSSPVGLLLVGFQYAIFFVALLLFILLTWPSHFSLQLFINQTTSAPWINTSSSKFIHTFQDPPCSEHSYNFCFKLLCSKPCIHMSFLVLQDSYVFSILVVCLLF